MFKNSQVLGPILLSLVSGDKMFDLMTTKVIIKTIQSFERIIYESFALKEFLTHTKMLIKAL